MERDDTDDSRFTIEKLEMKVNEKKVSGHNRLISDIMDAVCFALDERLKKLEDLVEKNKRDLRKCHHRFEKYKDIIENYGEAELTDSLSSVIRYYFALAKCDKLDLEKRQTPFEGHKSPKLEYEMAYVKSAGKAEQEVLENEANWLTSYKTVRKLTLECQ